jgi:exopolysaccharide production protein ExoZ
MEGIRGLAILLVFCVHYHTLFSPYLNPKSLSFRVSELSWGMGQSGVDLFFVLSGYLIYGAVIRKPTSYLKFMRRRVERIYPTFLAVFALYLFLCAVFPTASKLPSGAWHATIYILQNLAFLPGIFAITPLITVAWSLSYEFFFYFTIPLLVLLTSMRKWKHWQRVLFFLTLAALRFTTAPILPIRMAMFTGGILVYEALHSDWLRAKLTFPGELFSSALLLASFVPIAFLAIRMDSAGPSADLTGHWVTLRVFVMWFSYSLFAIYCLGRQGFLSSLFSWTPLRWMGNMSYSYYLIHGVTLQGLKLICQHLWTADAKSPAFFWALLTPALLATITTSTILFWLIEKRFSLRAKTSPPLTSTESTPARVPRQPAFVPRS